MAVGLVVDTGVALVSIETPFSWRALMKHCVGDKISLSYAY